MSIEGVPIDAIEESHLEEFVNNGISERTKLEYKLALPGDTAQEKREFLKDVSSFANAVGGHIIYGIRERDGVPEEICGLGQIDADSAISRLENMIRDGIRPRIGGVSVGKVKLSTSGVVALIVRVSPSWAKPHMVVFQDVSKFYSRNSNGTYSLDVDQLRAAFALSDHISELIRTFRLERMETIRENRLPVSLDEFPKMVVHVVPVSGLTSNRISDLSQCERDPDIMRRFPPETSRLWYDLDGVLFYSLPQYQNKISNFMQIFRNGAIEICERIPANADPPHALFETDLEQRVVGAVSQILSIQGRLAVEPPFYVALSLVGVAGRNLNVSVTLNNWGNGHPIGKNELLLPDVGIASPEADLFAALRPSFDVMWSAAGWPRSMNYDNTGKRVGWFNLNRDGSSRI